MVAKKITAAAGFLLLNQYGYFKLLLKGLMMKPISAFQFFCLTTFSKPSENRAIYQVIRKNKFRSIVEIGMGDGTRAEKTIQVSNKFSLSSNVRYTGVDLFEGRDEGQPKLQLRDMHKRLSGLNAKIQLVPGDVNSAIARIANSHVRTDLIVVSAGVDEDSLAGCWFYFPRMLHAESTVMIQYESGVAFKMLSRLDIEKLAEKNTAKRSIAA